MLTKQEERRTFIEDVCSTREGREQAARYLQVDEDLINDLLDVLTRYMALDGRSIKWG